MAWEMERLEVKNRRGRTNGRSAKGAIAGSMSFAVVVKTLLWKVITLSGRMGAEYLKELVGGASC